MPTASIDDIVDDAAPASAGTSATGGTANVSDILTPDSFMEEQAPARPHTASLSDITPDSFMADQPSSGPHRGTVRTPASFVEDPAASTPASFVADDPLDTKAKTAADLPSREEFEASHHSAVASWWERAKDFVGGVAAVGEAAAPLVYKKAQTLNAEPLVPESVMPPPATTPLGAVGRSALEFARGMTSPQNITIGALAGPFGKIAPLLGRAVSAGFGLQMLKGAYDQYPEIRDAIQKKDWTRAAGAITTAALSGGLGVMAGAHAVRSSVEAAPVVEQTPLEKATASARAGVEALGGTASVSDIEEPASAGGTANVSEIEPAAAAPEGGTASVADIQPEGATAETGPHGPVTRDYVGNPRGAVEFLRGQGTGYAADAIPHPDLGPIGLPYGVPGAPENDFLGGYGIAHVDAKHPGYLDQNIERIGELPVAQEFQDAQGRTTAAVLFDGKHRAIVSKDWMGDPTGNWLLTAYERPAPAASVSVREAPESAGPTPPATGATPSMGEEGSAVNAPTGPVERGGGTANVADIEPPRESARPPAIGRDTNVLVPGETTSYPARYAVRELADVQPSHNAFSFEPNPNYEYTNDRDYSRPQNAARVVQNAAADTFNPDYPTTDSPTAEHGAPIIDASGNVLGGNSRTMSIARVYQRGGPDAAMYRDAIATKAGQFGLDPDELDRFQKPVLVRELGGGIDAQRAITDFNKAAAAELSPEERAVSDGRRLSPQTVQDLAGRLDDLGDQGTLAEALHGDDGAAVLNRLVRDGVMTEQEKGGYLDDRGNLTTEAKSRIGKALVGRLFDSPAEFRETTPAVRAKLERIAPQLLRVEGRQDWSITDTLRQAIGLSEDARVHKMPIEETARQSVIGGDRGYTPEAIEMAKTLEQGPVKASTAFRRYANDEALSREGSQGAFFTPPTRAEAFADAFGGLRPEAAGERGAVNIAPLSEALERKFPEGVGGEPRSNYSGMGAARDKFIRNLSQLEEASPKAHAAAVRAATSRAQSAALLRSAMPRIEEALGGDVTPEDFRRALIEGRLQGLRQRWSELASDPRSAFANDPERPRRLLELLGHIEGKRGLPQDLRQTAASLMERSDVPTLESFLRETFTDAANSVARAMDAGEFDRIRNAPGFRQGLATYKRLLEQPLAENHASNEGVFSDALGPLKTYYPLVPVKGSEEIMARSAARTPYSKPRNIANQFATGLGAQYDPGVAALGERIAAALRTNNRAALIDTLEQQGLLHRLDRGEQAGDAIEIGGQAYRASVVETAPSRTIIKDGKFATSPAERAVVPEWLDKELAPILQAKDLRMKVGLAQHLSDAITALSLFGPTDISAHANNLLGTLVANTPFVGKSFLSAPFMKRFTATVKIIATDPTTAEAARDLGQMARLGVLPERYATETFSSKAAAQLGAERKYFSLGPLLYGPKGLDVRARLVMYRLAKELNPDATPLQMYKFVGQLGNYTRQLQSEIERSARASGMSPFYTAGSQMVRNGVNAFLGTGPMPKTGVGLRIAQQLTGGAVGAVGMWATAYRAYTGKWPWEDNRAKFLKIPVNEGDRRSWLGRKLWGDGPETGYVDFGYFNPLVARGARALGVSQVFDTSMAGGNARQIRESAATGPINAVVHPFVGPPARALFVGVTGQDPYVSGLRDREGRPGLQLLPADTKASSFPHLGAALREVSGIQGRLGEATGFLPATGMAEHGNPYFRMVADLALPGLFAQASNVPGKAAALARERRSVDKAAEQERLRRAQGAR